MDGPVRQIRPGETFYLFGRKIHYVGCVESHEAKVHVFWGWNKCRHQRYYQAFPDELFDIDWEFMRKTK